MVKFSAKFWHRISSTGDDTRYTECIRCCSNRHLTGGLTDGVLSFVCYGDEVKMSVIGFEDFDFNTAKEVMDTLRDILDEDGIYWVDKSATVTELENIPFVLLRTHITYRGNFYSVILGTGTYGFEDYKLELMSTVVNDGEPVGGLTVTKVIDILKNGYNPEV